MKPKLNTARIIGICFIMSFLSYGIGAWLIESAQQTFANNNSNQWDISQLIIGIVLVSVFHTLFNVFLLRAMYKLIRQLNLRLSKVYLYAGLVATILLAIGGIIFLLPLMDTDEKCLLKFNSCSQLNFYLYQVGMFFWGIGGMALCVIFYINELFPIWFAITGLVAYFIFVIGVVLELNQIHVGMYFNVLGGSFELIMSIWLMIRGTIAKNPASPIFS